MSKNTTFDFDLENKRAEDRQKGITAETPVSIDPGKNTNSVFQFDTETQRAEDRSQGYTAANPKPQGTSPSIYDNGNYPKATPSISYPNTGYQSIDRAGAARQVGQLKDAYSEGQLNFHSSDTANGFRAAADDIRAKYNLSDTEYGSGVTSRDVYNRWEKIHELGTIKSEFEEKHALDPSYANSEEGLAKRRRADEIRAELGLSDTEYGSGVTGADVLQKASGIKSLYDVKNQYETYWNSSPEAKSLHDSAESLRKIYGLSDAEYGSGVTAETVDENLNKLYTSPEYQRDLSYQKYTDTNQKIHDQIAEELSDEVKMRAIIDRAAAADTAEKLLGPQLQKEIDDRLAYEDELAAQRGSYGQLSYGKRRAIAEERMNDSKAARILALVNSLLEEDQIKANNEYQEAITNKNNRLNALNQMLTKNQDEFTIGQQYRGEISQETAAQQDAIYNSLKEQYTQAFEMSNALGYVTPELAAFAGVEAGTPMFKMVEYYGDLEKFYADLDQKAQFQAQDIAIQQYNAETDRMYASRPSYSYSGGGNYNGSYGGNYSGSSGGKKTYSGSNYSDNTSGDGTLTWNQAKAIWETFSTDYSENNGKKKPSHEDIIRFVTNSGFGPTDQTNILYAAGLTNADIAHGVGLANWNDYQDSKYDDGKITALEPLLPKMKYN